MEIFYLIFFEFILYVLYFYKVFCYIISLLVETTSVLEMTSSDLKRTAFENNDLWEGLWYTSY